MAGSLDEKVSALVDGELPHEEINGVFDDLKRDKAAQASWRHYHLISDALKNNLPDKLPEDFVSRVSLSLEAEPLHFSPSRRMHKYHDFLKPAIGFALAASVAGVAFLGLGWNTQPADQQAPTLAANVTPPATVNMASVEPVSYTKVHGRQWDVEQPAVIAKLDNYLLNHDQYSSVAGMRNEVMPQVRTVGYETPESSLQDPAVDNGR